MAKRQNNVKYSQSCLNPYLFVQAQKYGLLQCMGYGNGAKN